MEAPRAAFRELLDDLEYHRSADVAARLERAILAYAEVEGGDRQRAWAAAGEMRHLAEANSISLSPPLLDTLARAHIGIGEYDAAAAALEAGIEGLSAHGDIEADTPAGLLLTLAEVQLMQDRPERVRGSLERCRVICAERSLGGIGVELLRVEGELCASEGRFEEAYQTFKVFHTESLRLSSLRRESNARTRQALFETAEARHDAQRFWRQARTDALTGLPNRRFIDEEFPLYLDDVVAGTPLVVAIIDADHFKRVNDSLSHEVGDRAICELARVFEGSLPIASDPIPIHARFVARLGGEEFLVALPGLDMGAAERALQAVRSAVASHEWSRIIGPLSLTVSIGAAAARNDDTLSSILARADHNLYIAKAAGRNRLVVDELPAGRPRAARGKLSRAGS